MGKITIKRTKVNGSKYNRGLRWVVYYPKPESKKKGEKYFDTKTSAEQWKKEQEEETRQFGQTQAPLTTEERFAVTRWREEQKKLRKKIPLIDVVNFYIQKKALSEKSLSCQVVLDEMLKRLKTEGNSNSWISTLGGRLKKWIGLYGDWLICDISQDLIDEYLIDELEEYSPQTVKHKRQAINQLCNYGITLQALDDNPCEKAFKPPKVKFEPEILTTSETLALLESCSTRILPAIAIALFAGLRRSEISYLDWEDIDFDDREIKVSANISKTDIKRYVEISENLMLWLQPYEDKQGSVVKSEAIFRKDFENAIKKSGIEYPHNALRHSFASYHLAMYKNENLTASMTGHSNSHTLRKHYLKMTKKKNAEDYWKTTPKKHNAL